VKSKLVITARCQLKARSTAYYYELLKLSNTEFVTEDNNNFITSQSEEEFTRPHQSKNDMREGYPK